MKEMLEKVDYSSNPENKHRMNELFEMAMCGVKDSDMELYNHIKCELYETVYGKKVNDTMADKWVKEMRPMAKWTKEQIASVAGSYAIDIPLNCAYVIMNMKYSDDKNILGDGDSEESLMKYIEATKNWYYDEDYNGSGEEKTYDYGKDIMKIKY